MPVDADTLTDEQIRRYATPAGAQAMREDAEATILGLLHSLEHATRGQIKSIHLVHKAPEYGPADTPLELTAVKLKLEV
jgi:hypothetical protein